MLILTEYIAKHEFKPLNRYLSLDEVISGAGKVVKGFAVEMKAPRPTQGYRFFKVRIGKRNNARMIVFVVVENKTVVPVLIRLKKDKTLGMNMAMNDPKVVAQINKNLDCVFLDIKNKRYQEFDV